MSSNQPQRSSELDFLDGIDEQFQRLMKLNGNGKRGSHTGRSGEDRLINEILDAIDGLTKSQRQQVLAYVQSLTQKAE